MDVKSYRDLLVFIITVDQNNQKDKASALRKFPTE